MRTARNLAILALLAVPVAFVPGGGDAAQGVLTVLLLGFLAALGIMGMQLYRSNSLMLDGLPDGRRWLLYGAIGVIVLMISGQDELLATGAGTLAWIALLCGSLFAIFWVWRESSTY